MLTQLSLFEQSEYKATSPIAPTLPEKVRASTTPNTVAEYFAGIGLVRLGLQQAGWQVVYANDFDASKHQMYSSYFPDGNHHRDLFHLERRSSSLLTKPLKKALWTHHDLDWNFTFCPSSPPRKKKQGLGSLIEKMSDDDTRWWDQKEVKRHFAMMAPAHLSRVNSLMNQSVMNYRTVYRRTRQGQQRAEVRHDDMAGCLRTAKGGSSRQIIIAAGKGQVKMRHMTPREYARLQGVPDEYPIPPNTIQALNGFGDAVCVPVVRWIAEEVLKPLMLNKGVSFRRRRNLVVRGL